MNEKRKKKQPSIIAQSTTHWSISIFPMFFTLVALYYTFNSVKINPLLLLVCIVMWGCIYYFNFYGKKIVLTERKIYIFSKNKKILSWSLIEDFAYINYEQSRINKIFNCGTLIIVSSDKQMYTYFFLKNIKEIHDAIITTFENEMSRINPSYIRQYKPEMFENQLDRVNDNTE